MHLIYPILTRSNQLNHVININSSSCSIIFHLNGYNILQYLKNGLINWWKKNIFKKRIKWQLLSADCSLTQRTSAHKSFQRSAAQQAFTNKRIPALFQILFWLQQCKSVSSSAGELKNSTVVFHCTSANPMAVPILFCINRLVSLFLPVISFASPVQTNVLLQGTAEWVWMHWSTSELISWMILMSNN